MKSTMLAILMLLIYSASFAQEGQPGDFTSPAFERCRITVTSNLENAIVILDGRYSGTTPCSIDTLLPGKHHVRVLHPDIQNWLTESFDDSLEFKSGETKSLSYEFHPRFTLTSEPFDAKVMMGDSLIGKTPLVIQTAAAVPALKIAKPGFETASPLLSGVNEGLYSIPLKNLSGDVETNTMFKNSATNNRPKWPLFVAGVVSSVLSGAIAAHLKGQADNTYAEYRLTGDPALLAKTNRLDTGATIAIMVTQIQLGLFTYLLLSE